MFSDISFGLLCYVVCERSIDIIHSIYISYIILIQYNDNKGLKHLPVTSSPVARCTPSTLVII